MTEVEDQARTAVPHGLVPDGQALCEALGAAFDYAAATEGGAKVLGRRRCVHVVLQLAARYSCNRGLPTDRPYD